MLYAACDKNDAVTTVDIVGFGPAVNVQQSRGHDPSIKTTLN